MWKAKEKGRQASTFIFVEIGARFESGEGKKKRTAHLGSRSSQWWHLSEWVSEWKWMKWKMTGKNSGPLFFCSLFIARWSRILLLIFLLLQFSLEIDSYPSTKCVNNIKLRRQNISTESSDTHFSSEVSVKLSIQRREKERGKRGFETNQKKQAAKKFVAQPHCQRLPLIDKCPPINLTKFGLPKCWQKKSQQEQHKYSNSISFNFSPLKATFTAVHLHSSFTALVS